MTHSLLILILSYRNYRKKQQQRVRGRGSSVRRGGGASELDDSAGSDLPPGLKAMRNENVLLTLPGNYKVSNQMGLSQGTSWHKGVLWQGQDAEHVWPLTQFFSVSFL